MTCVLVLLGLAGVTAVSTAQTVSTTEGTPVCDPAAPAGSPEAMACPPPEPPPPADPPPVDPPADPAPPGDPAPQAKVEPPPPAPESPTSGLSAPGASESERPRPRRSCSRRADVRQSPAARRRAAAWRRKNCPRSRHRAGGEEGQDPKRSVGERRRRAGERRAALEERTAKKCKPAVVGQLVPLDRIGQCRSKLDRGQLLVGRVASKPLPDPLPPGSRLDARFARLLVRTAGPQWPLVLASLRAQGKSGAAPAGKATIAKLAKQLRGGGAEERVQALADYHRAAGIAGLTRGLAAVKGELIRRVLSNPKISIYGGGRSDVAFGGIDVRPLVVMLYLAERQGGVTVTSLITGHGIFTKSGNISLHSFGRAVDIGAVGATPISGNQQPGGVTESALRNILMLPAELRPVELISLFALGGPSFAMADHADHIHVGY